MSEIDAPDIAKDYYGLPKAAKLRDVIIAVRQDEQGYSDPNHEIADALAKG
jgi:ubiquinol oxidase